jgi:hypothetical protein
MNAKKFELGGLYCDSLPSARQIYVVVGHPEPEPRFTLHLDQECVTLLSCETGKTQDLFCCLEYFRKL